MAAHSERVEDSVQASLSELRRIEQARTAAVREAKERARRDVAAHVAEADRRRRAPGRAPEREADERAREVQRLAAAHALARDRDREHIEAEARKQERRRALEQEHRRALEQERQRLEIERLRALAAGAPRRSRVILAAVIAVAIAGMAFLSQHQSEVRSRHATPAPDRTEVGSLRGKLEAAESAVEDARRRTARLREQVAAFESERQAATSERRAREARDTRPRNRDTRPASPPREAPPRRRIELGDCKDAPLGCVP